MVNGKLSIVNHSLVCSLYERVSLLAKGDDIENRLIDYAVLIIQLCGKS